MSDERTTGGGGGGGGGGGRGGGGFKWLSIFWAILIGIGIIALAGSLLLPSTKRARVDWDEVRRLAAEEQATAAATQPTTAATAQQ